MKKAAIWITGLSGAGKTTIGNSLKNELLSKNNNLKVVHFDGDVIRNSLERKYGYSLDERKTFINNIIYLTKVSFDYHDTDIAIVSVISPLKEMRDNARNILTGYCGVNFVEVFLDVSLDTCELRDPKGLYKKARSGEIKEFTGINSPYETPDSPEIHISEKYKITDSIEEILKYLHTVGVNICNE